MLKSSIQGGKVSKVVVCGLKGCGKTSILEQFIYGNHIIGMEMIPTIEDIYMAYVDTDRGMKEKVLFYDTAGLELPNCEVSRAHVPHADGVILVYSNENVNSFNALDFIKKDIDKHKEKKEVAYVILANKTDLVRERQVNLDTSQFWAQREKVKLFEVSVADPRSLIEPFVYLTSKMNPPPSKSAFTPLVRKGKAGTIPLEL